MQEILITGLNIFHLYYFSKTTKAFEATAVGDRSPSWETVLFTLNTTYACGRESTCGGVAQPITASLRYGGVWGVVWVFGETVVCVCGRPLVFPILCSVLFCLRQAGCWCEHLAARVEDACLCRHTIPLCWSRLVWSVVSHAPHRLPD